MIMKYKDFYYSERIFIAVKDNFLHKALKTLIDSTLIQGGYPVIMVKNRFDATVIVTDEPLCLPELAYSAKAESRNCPDVNYVFIHNGEFPTYYEKCHYIISFIDINNSVESSCDAILKIVTIDSVKSHLRRTSRCSKCIRKNLTDRETNVIILMSLGYNVNKIAQELKCHPKRIYYYQGSVKRKLGLSSKVYFQQYLNAKVGAKITSLY
ncbi:TPA: LuxR C-terminal-related transcriptional regulator [Serratia fonticola]